MFNKIKMVLVMSVLALGLGLTGLSTSAVVQSPAKAPIKAPASVQKTTTANAPVYMEVNALDVVANPAKYLNKRIKIRAKFDKFSTLGLDYKPALRSSEDYISFLIKRDDVVNHTVPLSEMKIFLKRDEAEKYIDLNAGDVVEFSGKVFSNALSDVWVDVEKFTVISSKPKEIKK